LSFFHISVGKKQVTLSEPNSRRTNSRRTNSRHKTCYRTGL